MFSLGRWSSRIPTGFHVSRGTWVCLPESPADFAYRTVTFCGQPFQDCSAIRWFFNSPTELQLHPKTPLYPLCTTLADLFMQKVWALPSSLAATGGIATLLSLPPGTKMVHFPGFASRSLLYSEADIPILIRISLQDSDTPGSQPVCGSPRLFAAYHVLPRLPSPRHPPYALSSLTIKFAPLKTLPGPKQAILWPSCLFLPVVS